METIKISQESLNGFIRTRHNFDDYGIVDEEIEVEE